MGELRGLPGTPRIQKGCQVAGQELAVNFWCDLVMISFLWVAVIAGLIRVVRDCIKDRHLEPPLLNLDAEDWQTCGLDCLEILPSRREQP